MQPSASQSSVVGYQLADKYRVLREIGRGGMGVVYEAEHAQLGKRVAIKLMLEKYTNDKDAVARFQREALAASRIGNPHIIDVSDIGTSPDGRPFVVMELLQGRPLGDEIARVGALAPTRALAIIRQVLRAVGAAHAKGIIHRDLKPDNIYLIDHDGSDFVKLLDFGISKMLDTEAAIAATKLTTTGMVMGTPLYMAPEQAMGGTVDQQADLYAIGVILYEMLSGRPPFEGATYPVLIAKLLTAEPTSLKDLQPHLSPRLIAAVHTALEKDPIKRHTSADAFLAALPSDKSPSQVELAGTVGIDSMQLRAQVASATAQNIAHQPVKSGGSKAWMFVVAGSIVVIGGAFAAYAALSTKGHDPAAQASQAPPPAPAADVKPGAPEPVKKAPVVDDAPKPTVGKLDLKTNPPGATVAVDKNPAGTTPLEIALPPGKHHIHVELAKYGAVDDDEDIVVGEKTSIVIPLQPAQPTKAVGVAQPPRTIPQIQHTQTPIAKPPVEQPHTIIEDKPPQPQQTAPVQTPPRDTKQPGTKPNPYD